jgi:hypothetical protein
MKNEDDIRKTLSERLGIVSSENTNQYKAMFNAAAFATGDQWSKEDEADRDGRPTPVLNFTGTYIQRIVNPFRMNPFGIKVTAQDKKIEEIITGKIIDIENRSNAPEAYETALENAVTGGMGWIAVRTDYVDDESLDQNVIVDRVADPTSCYLDPFAEAVDGSDATYGFYIKYISTESAKALYGDEALQQINGVDLYKSWEVPQDSTADMLYYEVEQKSAKRYWLEDGRVVDTVNEWDVVVNSREVIQKKVIIRRYVGQYLVSENTLDIPFIPLVPVYGDRDVGNEGIKWAGILRRVEASQKMVNSYAASEQELVALAPKSPWIINDEAIESYDKIWATANTRPHAYLPWKLHNDDGTTNMQPTRNDNTANTQGLIQSRGVAASDMAKETGIFDNQLGNAPSTTQSGIAAAINTSQGEISTAQYMDNLSKSIKQVGRIIVAYARVIYDTNRVHNIVSADGVTEEVNFNLGEFLKQNKNIDISVSAGPSYASTKEREIETILEIGHAMPDKMPILADVMLDNLSTEGSKELSRRFKLLLPVELQDKDEKAADPQALMALQSAQQTIEELQQTADKSNEIISYLQTQLVSSQDKNKTDLLKAQMQDDAKFAIERLKQENENYRAELSVNANMEETKLKERNDLEANVVKIMQDKEKNKTEIIKESIKAEGKRPVGSPPGGFQGVPLGSVEEMPEIEDENAIEIEIEVPMV